MSRSRAARAAVAVALLGTANLAAPQLPDPGGGGQVAFLALVSFPLAALVVASMEPAARARTRILVAATCAAAAVAAVLIAADLPGTPATLAKLVGATTAGFALSTLLRSPLELVVTAVLIGAVDVYSVAAGPTHVIVHHHPGVLDAFTLAFHPAGTWGTAQVGVSDFLFMALFVAAARRLDLRPRAGLAAMTASFGVTVAISYATDAALPALPLLSTAFLAANADRLAALVRGSRGSPERES
jgi:hypothetical protein